MAGDDWSAALAKHYGVSGLPQLQQQWLAWVKLGCPAPPAAAAAALAQVQPQAVDRGLRGQSPDPVPPSPAPATIVTTAGRRSIYASQSRRIPEPGERTVSR